MGGCCGSSNERGKPTPPNGGVQKKKEPVIPDPEIKLYWIRMSQPSRALYTFLTHCRIKFEDIELQMGEQKKPEFMAINPKGLVPFMTVDGQLYNESCAVLRWLAGRFSKARMFYSEDPEERFEIEKALDFYTSEFRPKIAGALFVLAGAFARGQPLDKETIKLFR